MLVRREWHKESLMAGFNFEQVVASTVWTITHNLGFEAVIIDTAIPNPTNLEKIVPLNIEASGSNITLVTFSSPQTGRARVI